MTALGASLVCSVDSTRWPVSAAWIAISAVSRSRISPIMMMSGSWRSSERTPAANDNSMLMLHLHLVERGLDHFDRVFDRADVDLGRGELLQRRVQRGGLARTGRAGDQHDAVRLTLTICCQRALSSPPRPSSWKLRSSTSGSKIRITIFSPNAVGNVDRRNSISCAVLALRSSRGRPAAGVFRRHPSGRGSSGGCDHGLRHRGRQFVDLVHHTVDAKAHMAMFAARLDVDIAGALIERVLQQPVDDVDDVRVVGVRRLSAGRVRATARSS